MIAFGGHVRNARDEPEMRQFRSPATLPGRRVSVPSKVVAFLSRTEQSEPRSFNDDGCDGEAIGRHNLSTSHSENLYYLSSVRTLAVGSRLYEDNRSLTTASSALAGSGDDLTQQAEADE